jgi:hypothetical protein
MVLDQQEGMRGKYHNRIASEYRVEYSQRNPTMNRLKSFYQNHISSFFYFYLFLVFILGYLFGTFWVNAPSFSSYSSDLPSITSLDYMQINESNDLSSTKIMLENGHVKVFEFTLPWLSKKSKVHHISTCTTFARSMHWLYQSSAYFGNEISLLGMGDKRFQSWGYGFFVKLETVDTYVHGIPPDDVVIFSDCLDTLQLGSHAEIMAGFFTAINRSRTNYGKGFDEVSVVDPRSPSILFITEVVCWIGHVCKKEEEDAFYSAQEKSHEASFLNSGGYMGRAGDIAYFFDLNSYSINIDDQLYWTTNYVASKYNFSLPKIILDHENDVFLGMQGQTFGKDVIFSFPESQIKHARSAGLPSLLHFNGPKAQLPTVFHVFQNGMFVFPTYANVMWNLYTLLFSFLTLVVYLIRVRFRTQLVKMAVNCKTALLKPCRGTRSSKVEVDDD